MLGVGNGGHVCICTRVCMRVYVETCTCVCVFSTFFNAGFAFKKACFLCGGMVGMDTRVHVCVCVCVCEYMRVKDTQTAARCMYARKCTHASIFLVCNKIKCPKRSCDQQRRQIYLVCTVKLMGLGLPKRRS